jgi:hypothetical protein
MSNEGAAISGEYEFNAEQNRLIGDLARKMALVGFVVMLFGGLQMVNGVVSLLSTRNPEKVLAAAKEAGVPEASLQRLEEVLTSKSWLSPIAASSIAFALSGLFMFLTGLWTQSAAAGFAAVVGTKGQDIRRLMDGLGSLHKKYNLMYTLLWVSVIASLISFAFTLYNSFMANR